MRVGLISDTHGLLRPEALATLRGVDHILHAGDVGADVILDQLAELAPVTAIRGNIDLPGKTNAVRCAALPATEAVELNGRLFYLVHSVHDLDLNPVAAGIAVVVSGHSHKAGWQQKDGVLYLNPGSAGPRRFKLPVTLAILELGQSSLEPEIVTLIAD